MVYFRHFADRYNTISRLRYSQEILRRQHLEARAYRPAPGQDFDSIDIDVKDYNEELAVNSDVSCAVQ